jgi:hypothetical protein
MSTTVNGLYELAGLFLDVCEDALSTTVGGTPTRSYVAPARPAFDCCPFLSVHVANITEETTSPVAPPAATGRRTEFGRLNLVGLVATIVRCAPEVDEQGLGIVSSIESVAQTVQQDAWALWCGLAHAIQCEEFSDLCSVVHVDRGVSIPEQGGCVGWEFQIRVQLEGIENPGCGSS